MANRQAAKRASQEQYFFEYVDQLDRHRKGRLALVVTLSGIDTSRALQSTQNLVSDHIRSHMAGKSFELFYFHRGDVAVLTKDVGLGFVQDMAFGLIFQLQDEEFFKSFANGEEDLCRVLDVEKDYKTLKTYAKAGLHKGPIPLPGDPMGSVALEPEREKNLEPKPEPSPTLTNNTQSTNENEQEAPVARFVETDQRVGEPGEADGPDQSSGELQTRRDEIVQILDKEQPQIVMSTFAADEGALIERFLKGADEETYAAYLPGILQEAEVRMMDHLTADDPHLLPEQLGLAVQVGTLLSAAFLNFDRMRASMSILPRSLLILDRADMRANGETFKFAREFVEGRGHQLALRGLALPSLERVRLKDSGFLFQFVEWDAFEASLITRKARIGLKAAVEDEASAVSVLTGCDDVEALEFGRSIGIKFFEGKAAAHALFLPDPSGSMDQSESSI